MRLVFAAAALMMLGTLLLTACKEGGGKGAPAEHPTVFADLSYEDAKAAAAEQDKLLILDFSAIWCIPCKEMEKTTWIDERVVDWMNEHAVAIQVDYDKRRDLVDEFGVGKIPDIFVLRDGEVLDHAVGNQSADEFLDWLNGLL